MIVLYEHKLQRKMFDSFQSRDKMCFPLHNSSQGKQFNLAENSKNFLSLCYVVTVCTNMKSFSTLEGVRIQSGSGSETQNISVYLTNALLQGMQRSLQKDFGPGWQWGWSWGYWEDQETREEMMSSLSLEVGVGH